MKRRITHSRASITSFLLSRHLEFPVFLSNSRTNSLNEGRSTELLLRKRRTVPFSTTPFHWRAGGGGGGRRGAANQNQNAPKCMSFQLYATRRKKRGLRTQELISKWESGAGPGRAAPATTVQNGTEGLTPAHPSSRTLHEAPGLSQPRGQPFSPRQAFRRQQALPASPPAPLRGVLNCLTKKCLAWEARWLRHPLQN